MENPTSNGEKYRKVFIKYGPSVWLAACLLAILATGVVLDTLWSLALVIPTFFLFLLSLLHPPQKKPTEASPPSKTDSNPNKENFWGKRTFDE